ncbi:MAG: putative 2-hydroxy-3-oxopropionate reductase [Ramlibacter sp.]|nr:putative 2-hydroxy-3-oxopropionate reductase [Ramlibacter sp.]
MKKNVGMIGIGMMGHGIASNVIKKGWPLAVLEHPGNRAPSSDRRISPPRPTSSSWC